MLIFGLITFDVLPKTLVSFINTNEIVNYFEQGSNVSMLSSDEMFHELLFRDTSDPFLIFCYVETLIDAYSII